MNFFFKKNFQLQIVYTTKTKKQSDQIIIFYSSPFSSGKVLYFFLALRQKKQQPMKRRTTETAIGITMATIVIDDNFFSPAYNDMHHLL